MCLIEHWPMSLMHPMSAIGHTWRLHMQGPAFEIKQYRCALCSGQSPCKQPHGAAAFSNFSWHNCWMARRAKTLWRVDQLLVLGTCSSLVSLLLLCSDPLHAYRQHLSLHLHRCNSPPPPPRHCLFIPYPPPLSLIH